MRSTLLMRVLSKRIVTNALQDRRRLGVARDDVLDALVAAYTAMRIADSGFELVPRIHQRDSRGLRMEMAYPVHEIGTQTTERRP